MLNVCHGLKCVRIVSPNVKTREGTLLLFVIRRGQLVDRGQRVVTGAILVSDIEKMLHANPHQKVSKFIGLVAKKGKVVLYKMNAPYIIVSLVM